MKVVKNMLVVTIINLLAIIAVTLPLPNTVPTHMNFQMVIDGYGTKWVIVLFGLLPIILVFLMQLYFTKMKNTKAYKQKYKNAEENTGLEKKILPIIILFITLMTWLPAFIACNYNNADAIFNIPIFLIVGMPMGLLMVYLSNFMGTIRYNRYFGVRTPWTLRNETVWKKTHRISAYTGVVGGIIILVCSAAAFFIDSFVVFFSGLFTGIILVAIIPIIYSYVVYKKLNSN